MPSSCGMLVRGKGHFDSDLEVCVKNKTWPFLTIALVDLTNTVLASINYQGLFWEVRSQCALCFKYGKSVKQVPLPMLSLYLCSGLK